MTTTGGAGQLSIDTLIGFRIASFEGPSYTGPLGVMWQSYSSTGLANNVEVDFKTHYTTFWFAPAADYFVIDHLSLGGQLEIAAATGTAEIPTGTNARTNISIPTLVTFTALPRVGYMIPIGDRFGIWPRLHAGYAQRMNPSAVNVDNPQTDRFSSFMIGADVPFIFRLNETFYLAAAPQFFTSLGGSHTVHESRQGTDTSANASFLEFGLKTGIGVLLDL